MPDQALLKPSARGWRSWSTKKKLLIVSGILLALVVIGVALGVGLGIGLGGNNNNSNNNNDNSGENQNPPSTPPTGNYTGWQPEVKATWQIELHNKLTNSSFQADVYDIDAFANPKSTISHLQSMNRKVICYFSAGTYEDWRPDKDKFHKSDLGDSLPDWPGEKWLDTNSDNVRSIMSARLDMAKSKGCDGVDPDNVDGYDNKNGLGLTEADAVDYVNWLADQAHSRNMSVGLKNAGAIIDEVIGGMQWSVNEQCAQYDECDVYDAFPKAGKPVFHIEYPKGQTNNDDSVSAQQLKHACDFPESGNFSTVIKNMDLDSWVETCH